MKLYKNITFGLLALTLGGVVASCSDFLDEKLTTQQTTDFFDTPEGIDQLAVGIYNNLRFHFFKENAYTTLITVRMSLLWVVMVPIKCGIIMMVVSSHRL